VVDGAGKSCSIGEILKDSLNGKKSRRHRSECEGPRLCADEVFPKELQMTKQALLKKLETAIDEADRHRLYGTLEIEFKAGEPTFIRKMQTEKLDERENPNGQSYRR
jgi:hypothetical protein